MNQGRSDPYWTGRRVMAVVVGEGVALEIIAGLKPCLTGIPDGAKVCGVAHVCADGTITWIVEHPWFSPLADGAAIPTLAEDRGEER